MRDSRVNVMKWVNGHCNELDYNSVSIQSDFGVQCVQALIHK